MLPNDQRLSPHLGVNTLGMQAWRRSGDVLKKIMKL
jgi:hypothetical protein